jgi:hypothetical protein
MQRTIGQAEQYLDLIADVMPRAVHEAFTAEVQSARVAANAMATRFMDDRTSEMSSVAEDVEEGLRAVRTEYRQLLGAAEAGRVSASDFSEQFAGLRQQQRGLELKTEEVERAAERVRTIEADPVAWADETFYGKYPRLRPLFSF